MMLIMQEAVTSTVTRAAAPQSSVVAHVVGLVASPTLQQVQAEGAVTRAVTRVRHHSHLWSRAWWGRPQRRRSRQAGQGRP